MAKTEFQLYLSHSQICVFLTALPNPFNDWSDRNFSQGFSWRDGSASFRSLADEGEHKINLFINEPVPQITSNIARAFKVPFESSDRKIEIASISDSKSFIIPAGKYALQVEFLEKENSCHPEINIRLNEGSSNFSILKADNELLVDGDFDLQAVPAT